MADYYEVLRRALAGLQRNTGEARRGVYEKARQALVRQLDGFDPPLPPTEVTRQRLALEECIRKVEAEAARESLGLTTPNPLPAPPPPAALQPAAVPQPQPDPYQQAAATHAAAAQPAAHEASIFAPPPPLDRPPAPPPAYPQAALAPSALATGTAEALAPPPPPAPPAHSADIFRQAIAEAEALGGAATEAARQARQVFDDGQHGHWPDEHPDQHGRQFADGADAARSRLADLRHPDGHDFEDEDDAEGYDEYGSDLAAPVDYDRVQTSRLPSIIAIAVVALVVLGVGALAYSQRDFLMSMLDSPSTETETPVKADTGGTDDGEGTGKNTDRLLSTKSGSTGSGSEPAIRMVPTTKVVPPTSVDDDLSSARGARGSSSETVEGSSTKVARTDGSGGGATTTTTTTTGAAVAQRSVLYEQGAEGGGRGFDGRVTWELATEKPAKAGDKPQTVLRIRSFIEDRGVEVAITMRKNSDPALPVSHLIELVFKLPENFPGKGIGNVPAMLMKPTEDARGDPLGGITARIGNGMYWIGLSSSDRDWQRNRKLLIERPWMDIPILYENGQKALLTLEKGIPGKRALEQAIAAWDAS